MIGAIIMGAATALTERLKEERVIQYEGTQAQQERMRKASAVNNMWGEATVQLAKTGRNKDFMVLPDYEGGKLSITPLNQYDRSTTSTTPALSPDPDLAFLNALSTKDFKPDAATNKFVQVNPGLTADDVQRGYFINPDGTKGRAVQAGLDYILFTNPDKTLTERGNAGLSNWRTKLEESPDALKLAIALANDEKAPNPTALNKIMNYGAQFAALWQKEKEPTELAAGRAYYQESPFTNNGPLTFMKDNPLFNDEKFFLPFMNTVAAQSPYEFLNSLREVGYTNIPMNNPVQLSLNGDAMTVQLTGDWADLQTRGVDGRGRPNQRGDLMWKPEFQQKLASWAARTDGVAGRSSRTQFEWMNMLNNAGTVYDPATDTYKPRSGRDTYNKLVELEGRIKKLGQPVDMTSGAPVYRTNWASSVQAELKRAINELGFAPTDTAAVVAALMPEDLYTGIRTKVYGDNKAAIEYISPESDLKALGNESRDLARSIGLAKEVRDTVIAGTGITAKITTLRAGARDQIRQITSMFGENPGGMLGKVLDALKLGVADGELDTGALDNITDKNDLLLRIRKLAVIQLMYSFAKGMGGSGSDRLSDQDAKYALEALGESGLLNTQDGLNLVMTALIDTMSRRQAIVTGLTSNSEREQIAGVFLNDMYRQDQGLNMGDIMMKAWVTMYNDESKRAMLNKNSDGSAKSPNDFTPSTTGANNRGL